CLIFTDKKIKKLPKTYFEKNFIGCEAGKKKLEIIPNGDVYPCIFLLNKKFLVGNVFEKNMEYLWKNKKVLKKLRDYVNRDKHCCFCKYFYFCNGGCIGRTFIHTGKIKGDLFCPIRDSLKDLRIIKEDHYSKKSMLLIKNSFKNTPFSKIKNFYKNLEKNKGSIYCLYFKKELVGIIQLLNKKNILEIEVIAVKKEYQKRGFGTMLISFAFAEAKKKKKKFLEVTTIKDYSVEKFYVKNLFRKVFDGFSIKFGKRCFFKIYKFADEISKENRIALIKKKNFEKLKNLKEIKILREYQTFRRKVF
ncbi:MAG: GNAT family N-acetyltransferase, partial [Candidatus Pacearchaeota archaeon]